MTTNIEQMIRSEVEYLPKEAFEVLTFGDLNVGDKYIIFPTASGHNMRKVFKEGAYVFEKLRETKNTGPNQENSENRRNGIYARFADSTPVIKLIK